MQSKKIKIQFLKKTMLLEKIPQGKTLTVQKKCKCILRCLTTKDKVCSIMEITDKKKLFTQFFVLTPVEVNYKVKVEFNHIQERWQSIKGYVFNNFNVYFFS